MPAIEIPALVGFRRKTFDLRYAQQVSPTGEQGFIQTLNRSSPYWTAEYETPPLSGEALNEMQVFKDSMEGSMNTFLAYDPRKLMPFAYRDQSIAATPWGANPHITGQDYAASALSFGNLAPGAILSKGDYVSAQVGNIWYLFRLQTGGIASGAGFASGLIVKPRPQIIGLNLNVIRYRKAVCEMKIIGGIQEEDSVEDTGTSFRFKAVQHINRAS